MLKRLIYKKLRPNRGKIEIIDRKTNEGTAPWFGEKLLMIMILSACILLTRSPLSNARDNPVQKVLVLNSYHGAFEWTDRIVQGIRSVLETEEQGIEIYIEYMDSKRFSSKAYIRELEKIYTLKFSGLKFDVIISSDDNAFHFLLENHNDLFADTPVVFSGVNYFTDSMLKGHKLFTGVVESTEIKSNIELILKLHPETKSIAVITDNTTTGEGARKVLEQVSMEYSDILEIVSLDGSEITAAEVLNKPRDLPEGGQVLLLNFHRDRSDRFISFTRFTPMLSARMKTPLYCASDNFLGHGIAGGMLTSAFHQGEAAGKMARLILGGEDVANIPVLKKSPNQYMFDYKQMKRFGIKLSGLPEGSFVINRPHSFYTDYKRAILVFTASIITLIFIIFILVFSINSRKRAEQARRESESGIRAILDNATIHIWAFDGERYLHLSREWYRYTGQDPTLPLTIERWTEYVHPDDLDKAVEVWQNAWDNKSEHDNYFRLRNARDEYRWMYCHAVPVFDEKGDFNHFQGFNIDIHDRMLAEKTLRESEEQFALFMAHLPAAVFIKNEKCRTLYVNRYLIDNFGAKDWAGKTTLELFPGKTGESMIADDRKALAEGYHKVIETAPDIHGVEHVFKTLKFVIEKKNNQDLLGGISLDITEQVKVRRKLERSELWMRCVFNSLEEAVFVVSPDRELLNINKAAEKMFGCSKDELSGLSTEALHVDSEHFVEFDRRIKEAFDAGKAANFEFEAKKKNGEIFPTEHTVSLFNNESGAPIGIVSVVRDITHRKRAEKESMENRNMLQTVFDGISDPLIMVNKNMKMLLRNRAAMKYYGVSCTVNCIAGECRQVFNGSPSPCEGCAIPSAVSNGRHESFERKGFMDPERLEQVVIYPLHQKDNREGAAIIRISDVTRERRMERELIQADKMISLGVLVSGVAHEIDNPNNFIMLNEPLLRKAWESIAPIIERYFEKNGDFCMGGLPYSEMRDEIPQLFSGIKEGSKRIRRIVRELKDYSRQDGADMDQPVNINRVIKSAVRLTGNLIKKSCKNFRVAYGRNLPLIRGNKQKLDQVVINLIQNACQALPDNEKGIFLTTSLDKEGGDVVVEVRDEGEGIPENLLPRIMDPFFTTKRSEGGTGLGMSISSNIVKGHGGRMEVESEWGGGTAIKVFIPTTGIERPVKILVADDVYNHHRISEILPDERDRRDGF